MTHDDKIVEAVARAIYHGKPRNKPWELLTHEFKNQYRKPARAAITAYQAEAGFDALRAAYKRGATWSLTAGAHYTVEELDKAAYDYADKNSPPKASQDRSEP